MNFEGFVQDIDEHQWNVHGVQVYEQGKLVHSFGDTNSRFPIYSVTKTITSIAAGMAFDERKIGLQQSILNYLPKEEVNKLSVTQTERFSSISLERLMTMSVAGFPFRPEGENWIRDALSCELSNVKERCFEYSNIPAYLVGVALSQALGEDLYQYLERKLFQPLQIVNPVFQRCPSGYFYGASGMQLSVEELSRIGLLLYHNGVYEGKRILSEAYIKEATGIRQMNREGGYGYFIWKYRDGFSINGKWGQKCFVLPNEGLVVTYLSHLEEGSSALRDSMERNILTKE
jgi:CubicO group peptidase (beta-lactamase class C family)